MPSYKSRVLRLHIRWHQSHDPTWNSWKRGFNLHLPLMSAGLAGQQELAYVVGTVYFSFRPGIQEHIGHDGNSMICNRTSYAPPVPEAGRTPLRHSS